LKTKPYPPILTTGAAGPASAPVESIAALLRRAPVETVPTTAAKIRDFCRHLEAGTQVYIVALPGQPLAKTLDTAIHLRDCGMSAVPHIAARRLSGRGQLTEFLRTANDEAGVDQILLIAGGRDKPDGPFDDSLQVLKTGVFEQFGIRRVDIAGHPEGHPVAAAKDIMAAMREKLEYARSAGLQMHVVTQFCFDPAAITGYLKTLHSELGNVPVHVGVPGPLSVAGLIRYARLCDIGDSVRYLTRGGSSVLRMASWRPEDCLDVLREFTNANSSHCFAGVHFFGFGGALTTARWLEKLRLGRPV